MGTSPLENVSKHVDMVKADGFTMRSFTEHGGHEIGTVGLIVTDTEGVVSMISSMPLTMRVCNTAN